MTIIDQDMRDIIERAMLAFVATVCDDGSPDLSPKGSVRVYDGENLVFMDIASTHTVANLCGDRRIEINVIDFFSRRGYRFQGEVRFAPPGDPAYEWLNSWLLEVNGPGYPADEAVVVRAERAEPILSPAYVWGRAEPETLTAAWKERYHDRIANRELGAPRVDEQRA